MLGFGFALFLIMVILALIYTQYQTRQMDTVQTVTKSTKSTSTTESAKPLPTAVTPDTAADDLIDEALADRDDLDAQVADEMQALEDGN